MGLRLSLHAGPSQFWVAGSQEKIVPVLFSATSTRLRDGMVARYHDGAGSSGIAGSSKSMMRSVLLMSQHRMSDRPLCNSNLLSGENTAEPSLPGCPEKITRTAPVATSKT